MKSTFKKALTNIIKNKSRKIARKKKPLSCFVCLLFIVIEWTGPVPVLYESFDDATSLNFMEGITKKMAVPRVTRQVNIQI